MPNNIINEIIFRNVNAEIQARILEKVVNKDGRIDFEILVPSPLNIWNGSVGERHEKTFPGTHLDWARENWGTKWNAYGQGDDEVYKPIVHTEDTLTFTFQTAWGPPYGWIIAIFNFFKMSFDHNWLDEGEMIGHQDKFLSEEMDKMIVEPWLESDADEIMQKHLHFLLYGCESFDEEEE